MNNNHSQKNEVFEDLLQKSYRFLSPRPRTEKEIRDYLIKKIKKFNLSRPEKFIDLVIDQLKKEGFVDDKKFIAWWVEQRSYFKPKGKLALKHELLQKGIHPQLINQYFEENKLDEFQLAKIALEKKIKKWESLKKEEKRQKAISFLVSRGFSFETADKIYKILNNH